MRRLSTWLACLAVLAGGVACRPRGSGSSLADIRAPLQQQQRSIESFAELKALIEDPELGIKKIEQLVEHLPPDLLSNYALMRSSGSLQESDPRNPRVILHSPAGRFYMSFNSGDRNFGGADRIETIEFDEAKATFVFREYMFPQDGGSDGDPHPSAVNPAVCAGCHKKKGRPLFDTYPKFPDAYFPGGEAGAREMAGAYAAWIELAADHPRYKHLIGRERFLATELQVAGEPARTLNTKLQARMDEFLAREVMSHPRYEQLELSLHAAAFGCPLADVEALIPPAVRSQMAIPPSSVLNDTRRTSPDASDAIAHLRWLFESFNIPTTHWSTNRSHPYSFARGPDDKGPDIGRVLLRKSRLAPQLTSAAAGDICGTLKQLPSR